MKVTDMGSVEYFTFNQTKSFELQLTNVADFIVHAPEGWTIKMSYTKLSITAPASVSENEAVIKIQLFNKQGLTKIQRLFVYASAYTLKGLSFEDSDYKGTGNYIGKSDWSSLIDNPQYGGPLLYGQSGMGPSDYNWYDENNTLLQHEFPTNWGTTCYWGGGHAISNYVDMDLTHGGFNTSWRFITKIRQQEMEGITALRISVYIMAIQITPVMLPKTYPTFTLEME